MATLIQLRRDITSNWTSSNPILAQGEIGVDITANSIKVGNGVDAWNSLDYIASQAVGGIDSEWVLSQLSAAPGSVDSDWVLSQIPTTVENQVDSEWVISYVSNTPPPTSSGGSSVLYDSEVNPLVNNAENIVKLFEFDTATHSHVKFTAYFMFDLNYPGEGAYAPDVWEVFASAIGSVPSGYFGDYDGYVGAVRLTNVLYNRIDKFTCTVDSSTGIASVFAHTINNLNFGSPGRLKLKGTGEFHDLSFV
jgi:hypothetical protein